MPTLHLICGGGISQFKLNYYNSSGTPSTVLVSSKTEYTNVWVQNWQQAQMNYCYDFVYDSGYSGQAIYYFANNASNPNNPYAMWTDNDDPYWTVSYDRYIEPCAGYNVACRFRLKENSYISYYQCRNGSATGEVRRTCNSTSWQAATFPKGGVLYANDEVYTANGTNPTYGNSNSSTTYSLDQTFNLDTQGHDWNTNYPRWIQLYATFTKASQSAPTAYGSTVTYGSTATATASGGGGQGSIEWSNGNTRTAIGSQTTQARWSGNSLYNASPWSNVATLTVNKITQYAPTAYGATVQYGNTATATASGGTGVGGLQWSNGNTRTAVGSQNTSARWAGNDYYYPSDYSNTVTLTVTKADQSSPTAYGSTVQYGNTATATTSGGGGHGSIQWSNGNTRTAIGSQNTQARWTGDSNYNASSWSNLVTLTVTKASQSAPTATGSSVVYPNTAYASASGGGGVGSLIWENGSSRSAVGSQATRARWSGNDYYDASPWSNTVYLVVDRATTAVAYATNPVYSGSSQTGVAGANVKWSTDSTTSATNVGTYTAYATPLSGYAWSNGGTEQRTITWNMTKKPIRVPTLDTTSYPYTGSTISPSFSYDADWTTSSGTLSATNAGNYTATFSLTDSSNTKWNDDTSSAKSIQWYITRVTGASYSQTNRTYDPDHYQYCYTSSSYVLWSGDFYMKDAGNYTATATPDSNHTWSDGTTGAKTVNWVMYQAGGWINLSPTTFTLYYPGSTVGVSTIGTNHGGDISVSHAEGQVVATVTQSDTAITFTASGVLGHGYYEVTCAATRNYTAASATVAITVNAGTVTVTYVHKTGSTVHRTTTSSEAYGSTITLADHKVSISGYTYNHAEDSGGQTITTATVTLNPTFYLFYNRNGSQVYILKMVNGQKTWVAATPFIRTSSGWVQAQSNVRTSGGWK